MGIGNTGTDWQVGGAIIVQGLRLSMVALGGWAVSEMAWPLWTVFVLPALAMLPMGLGTALFIKLSRGSGEVAKGTRPSVSP